MVWVLVVAGLLIWVGATLIIDALSWARRQPDLAERLIRYQARTDVDEVERWLHAQVWSED